MILQCLFTFTLLLTNALCDKDEEKKFYNDKHRLITDLMKDYETNIRPAIGVKPNKPLGKKITIKMGIDIAAIAAVNPAYSLVWPRGQVEIVWKDSRLSWDPKKYGSIDSVSLSIGKIWKPKFQIVHGFSWLPSLYGYGNSYAHVDRSGVVRFNNWLQNSIYCAISKYRFPFDVHKCELAVEIDDNLVKQKYNVHAVSDASPWRIIATRYPELPQKTSDIWLLEKGKRLVRNRTTQTRETTETIVYQFTVRRSLLRGVLVFVAPAICLNLMIPMLFLFRGRGVAARHITVVGMILIYLFLFMMSMKSFPRDTRWWADKELTATGEPPIIHVYYVSSMLLTVIAYLIAHLTSSAARISFTSPPPRSFQQVTECLEKLLLVRRDTADIRVRRLAPDGADDDDQLGEDREISSSSPTTTPTSTLHDTFYDTANIVLERLLFVIFLFVVVVFDLSFLIY
ncbi:acetylcholine receptor subunit gamma-like [Tubulanus polymorphus]|uniref:acetylcholine receptor subunit gamma-like n=1 Tax=Tubulanus polymorphus TaxID=672921 RepID=UPI003DA2EDD4